MALYPEKAQSHTTRTPSRVPISIDMQAQDLVPARPTKDLMARHQAGVYAHIETKMLVAEATRESTVRTSALLECPLTDSVSKTVNASTDVDAEAEATDDTEVFMTFKELLTFWQLKVESSLLLSRERIRRKFVGRRLVAIEQHNNSDSETR
ncbi:hypothetical protein B0H16DRAFT_1477243 [Mycena metata]|uniref:Uncharacterized protein n=1 Tax=Mycena metata TaxID=1033252 RepID=A0AAD7HAU6_9AGAR|nr:hypothetical protein B0H16DRAFT_1477243 [Mycena metata]